jgi:uncharacterized protein with PQ loop repeat
MVVLGLLAGGLITACVLPQLMAALRASDLSGVSVTGAAFAAASCAGWTLYATAVGLVEVAWSSAIGAMLWATIAVVVTVRTARPPSPWVGLWAGSIAISPTIIGTAGLGKLLLLEAATNTVPQALRARRQAAHYPRRPSTRWASERHAGRPTAWRPATRPWPHRAPPKPRCVSRSSGSSDHLAGRPSIYDLPTCHRHTPALGKATPRHSTPTRRTPCAQPCPGMRPGSTPDRCTRQQPVSQQILRWPLETRSGRITTSQGRELPTLYASCGGWPLVRAAMLHRNPHDSRRWSLWVSTSDATPVGTGRPRTVHLRVECLGPGDTRNTVLGPIPFSYGGART